MCAAAGISRSESLLSLLGVFIIFLITLAAAYFTTKWIGKSNLLQSGNRNIKIIETFRLSQTKTIHIVKIGDKYIAIGVSKEHMEFLTELTKEELNLLSETENKTGGGIDFKEVLAKFQKK